MSELRNAQQRMDEAETFQEWKEAAIEHDALSGADEWKKREHSERYDYATIRERLREIRKARRAGDDRALLFALNEGIHGNLGGMGKASLYTRSKFGTKRLITDYVEEVTQALRHISKVRSNVITKTEKKDFLHRASHCYGRSALMLSGAGALGPFHIGVIKTLLEQGLLPRVISGSSAGAMIAAIVGTHSDEALKPYFDAEVGVEAPIEQMKLTSVLGWRDRIQTEDLREMIETWIPDVTFAEAFQMTGRHINVSVAPFKKMQASRLLNAITSPNVLLREAVMASCAVPGVFPPVMLMARDADGEKQPYLSDMRWIDGSVTDDLPAKRLGRLYGVNHFIASQTNPIILWTIRNPNAEAGLFSNMWELGARMTKEWFKTTRQMSDRMTRALPNVNSAVNMFHSVALQEYTADINIIPRYRFWDPRKLLSPLDQEEMLFLIEEGEAATWPQVEMIRNCTIISHTLDDILEEMEGDVIGLYRPTATTASPKAVA
ncbi:MAG: DUF3336 domain-containing protein [Parvibaculaceae bacterium]